MWNSKHKVLSPCAFEFELSQHLVVHFLTEHNAEYDNRFISLIHINIDIGTPVQGRDHNHPRVCQWIPLRCLLEISSCTNITLSSFDLVGGVLCVFGV